MSRLPLLLFSLFALLLSGFSPQPPAFHSLSPHRSSTTQAPAYFVQPGSFSQHSSNKLKTIGIEINKRLDDADGDWRAILSIYTAEHARFNHVNWATTLRKLSRLKEWDVESVKASYDFRDLLRNLSGKMTASPQLRKFGGDRQVANILHALAKMRATGFKVDAIMDAVEANAEWLVSNENPQAIANTAWAFAKLNTPAPALLRKIEERASSLVDNGKPQEIAMTAWAFAALDTPAPALFEKIEKRASFMVENGNPQDIAMTAWAFAKLRHDAPALFSAVDSRSQFLIDKGKTKEISNTAWAFAELAISPASFFALLESRADEFLISADSHAICNVCWSLANLDLARDYERLVQSLWGVAMRTDATKYSVEELTQLVQTELHARSSGVELTPSVPPDLRLRMVEAVELADVAETAWEEKYSALLTELGFDHRRELCLSREAGDVLSIDMACPVRKIAVEYDGPARYLSSGRENGRTVAKRRLLERLGWKVVNISYQHSDRLNSREFLEKHKEKGDRKALQTLYLKKLMWEQAGLELPDGLN
jgi:hypothetical protein